MCVQVVEVGGGDGGLECMCDRGWGVVYEGGCGRGDSERGGGQWKYFLT